MIHEDGEGSGGASWIALVRTWVTGTKSWPSPNSAMSATYIAPGSPGSSVGYQIRTATDRRSSASLVKVSGRLSSVHRNSDMPIA